MSKRSRYGRVDGAAIAIIGIGLLVVLLAAIVITGIVWDRKGTIPEDGEGPTEAEVIELTRKYQAAIAKAEEALIAASQPTTLPADPRVEELKGQLGVLLERTAELEARLEQALKSSTQPSTSRASSEPSFPTTPETRPTFPATRPADK